MSARITDRDRGFRALRKRLEQSASVRVGILHDAPKTERDGASRASLLEVATAQEFGAPEANVPQASFLRSTVDAHASEVREMERDGARRVILGKSTPAREVERIGAKVERLVRDRIDATITDTGQLRDSVEHRVERSR